MQSAPQAFGVEEQPTPTAAAADLHLQIYPGTGRMSMMFTLPHTPGSLYRMIARFAALVKCAQLICTFAFAVCGHVL